MFRQAKKARSLMEDYQSVDEFDFMQLIMVLAFTAVLAGIWYYSMRADKTIEEDININNPIIKDFQVAPKVEDALEQYGNVRNLDSNQSGY